MNRQDKSKAFYESQKMSVKKTRQSILSCIKIGDYKSAEEILDILIERFILSIESNEWHDKTSLFHQSQSLFYLTMLMKSTGVEEDCGDSSTNEDVYMRLLLHLRGLNTTEN